MKILYQRVTVAKANYKNEQEKTIECVGRLENEEHEEAKTFVERQLFIPFDQLFVEAPIRIRVRKGGRARTLFFCSNRVPAARKRAAGTPGVPT